MSGKTAEMPLAEHRGLIIDGVIAGCQYIRGQRRIPFKSCQSELGNRAAAHAVLLDFEDQLLTFFECFQAGFHHCFRVNENSDAAVGRLNEAVALFQVEILDDTIEHAVSPGLAWSNDGSCAVHIQTIRLRRSAGREL
ncbi:hypothetical protein FHT29_004028 [Rhizobium sp. SG741]|nr:hypothetical protein [Rhizobium sp. SG741]